MAKSRKRKQLPTDLFDATIVGLSHEGRGIAKINQKTTFIANALPDEQVKFRYRAQYGQYDDGQAEEILVASPIRATPFCPHYSQCGGCSLQHMQHATQIQHKQQTVLELVAKYAHTQPQTIAPPIQGPTTGYRRKARLSVKYVPKKGGMLVGFREKYSTYINVMSRCDVLHPSVGQHIQVLRDLIANLEGKTEIPQLEIAVSDQVTALIVRHMQPLSATDQTQLIAAAQQYQWQLYLQPKGVDSIHCIWPQIPQPLTYVLNPFALTLTFMPHQFIQVNSEVNEQMVAQAIEWLDIQAQESVLDLFCGIGNFSLPASLFAREVIGVEANTFSIEQAQRNAENNKITNATFLTADLTQDCAQLPFTQRQFDKVILDPPRSGAKEILPYLSTWQPSKIVYISCDPSTLARDLHTLLTLGYALVRLGIMDMFPHTEHVETMALLVRV